MDSPAVQAGESEEVSFFHNDFSFEDIVRETSGLCLPAITDTRCLSSTSNEWDGFFSCHQKGSFFKPRRYICTEFVDYIHTGCWVFEVGCGYGCTLVPIMSKFPAIKYTASDFSPIALRILEKNVAALLPEEVVRNSLATVVLDIVTTPLVVNPLPSRVLAIFAISAIAPVHHAASLKSIFASVSAGGYFMFRDYAIHDMTMYRHKIRFGELFFQRSDGTLAYYFDLDYVDELFSSVGFRKVELRYDCVQCTNKRSYVDMKRVFVHAVYVKPSPCSIEQDIKTSSSVENS